MRLKQRITSLEGATADGRGQVESARKKRRLTELIALGSLRYKRQPEISVGNLPESDLLGIIGADEEGYERAVRDFAAWWRSDGRGKCLSGNPLPSLTWKISSCDSIPGLKVFDKRRIKY